MLRPSVISPPFSRVEEPKVSGPTDSGRTAPPQFRYLLVAAFEAEGLRIHRTASEHTADTLATCLDVTRTICEPSWPSNRFAQADHPGAAAEPSLQPANPP